MVTNDESGESIFVSSRDLAEYVNMFSLSAQDQDRTILDCAAGSASFTCELNARGGKVTAVDPMYTGDFVSIERKVKAGVGQASGNIRGEAGRYNWTYFADPEAHYATRLRSAHLFLQDFQVRPGSYVPGTLPNLPFEDRSFEIVLCSHLLFVYAGLLTVEFHVGAILEMFRICSKDVRIFPLVGFHYPANEIVQAVQRELDALQIKSTVVPVEYDFLKGSGHMLHIERA